MLKSQSGSVAGSPFDCRLPSGGDAFVDTGAYGWNDNLASITKSSYWIQGLQVERDVSEGHKVTSNLTPGLVGLVSTAKTW